MSGAGRGDRPQTPAEVALRMLFLKHVRNWSYETREREVRGNVVYRSFCRIGTEKVPDAKTLVRLGQAIGADTVRELHDRIVELARQRGAIRGRRNDTGRMRRPWIRDLKFEISTDAALHRFN